MNGYRRTIPFKLGNMLLFQYQVAITSVPASRFYVEYAPFSSSVPACLTVVGELALDGTMRTIKGSLSMALAAKALGITQHWQSDCAPGQVS